MNDKANTASASRSYDAKDSSYLGRPVSNKEHLQNTGLLAREYGFPVHLKHEAELAGTLHDVAKYSVPFQQVLTGTRTGIDHALPGAAILPDRPYMRIVKEAIAGHHGRLRSYESLLPYMRQVTTCVGTVTCPSGKMSAIAGPQDAALAMAEFQKDFPTFLKNFPYAMLDLNKLSGPKWQEKLYRMLLTRFLSSALTDADYTDSEYWETGKLLREAPRLDPDACLARLDAYRTGILQAAKLNNAVRPRIVRARNMVYQDCAAAGRSRHEFMTLSAPTGSAKTLGLLRLALERMKADPSKKRIIIVLPYLAISDQVEDVVRNVIPDVLVDNSLAEHGPDQRELTQRWSAPCVITTTVQFFESLFSDKPGKCRKLHRYANSVILFDEIQALPHHVTRYALEMLHWLSQRYNSTIVLSTATQPKYQIIPELDFGPHEIVSDVDKCWDLMKPTRLSFRHAPMKLSFVAYLASKYANCCVITNTRAHALEVYQSWQARGMADVFLLTTDLCPLHRREVIKRVKARQQAGETVHVAATQCIEAGIDLDFQKIFRAMAPMSALVQSAGRQNRNGKYPRTKITVFVPRRSKPGQRLYPDDAYEYQASIVQVMEKRGVDMNTPDAMRTYYDTLFRNFAEPADLNGSLMAVDFEDFARLSRLIGHKGCQVVVPYGDVYDTILDHVNGDRITRRDLRDASAVSVHSFDMDSVAKYCQELVWTNPHTGVRVPTGVHVLLPAYAGFYKNDVGLRFDDLGVDTTLVI